MQANIDHDRLEEALRRCGANWDAAQAHGLLAGRLATAGVDCGFGWLSQVLEGTNSDDALRGECEALLRTVFEATYGQLAGRQSAFEPLLPDDTDSMTMRAAALAHWCEGFLHGLVSTEHDDGIRQKLAAEPLADIIKDMLQITRAVADDDGGAEADEEAYAELVEYLRVAAQLAYEELAELRNGATDGAAGPASEVVH